jgi:predicted PurR-regulated permease PerM
MSLLNPRNLLYNYLITLQTDLDNFAENLQQILQKQQDIPSHLLAKLVEINQKLQIDEINKAINNLNNAEDENRHLYLKSLLDIAYGLLAIINAELFNRSEETPPDFYK